MSIPVRCPNCLYRARVAHGMAGRRTRCPDCDQAFDVPVARDAAALNPPWELSLAFLDEDQDVATHEERRVAPLVPRSVSATATIPFARRAVETTIGPASPPSLYLGLGIGIACAISLSAAFAIFLR